MELTIEQALLKGVTAQKEGNLEEAERFYRAILQSQPRHPDANHNLGLIAVSVNKADAALPLFKTAIEANPEIEQFWLSYIDTLLKQQQFEVAKRSVQEAKEQGLAGEKLKALATQLSAISKQENGSSLSPSQQQINDLSDSYQSGRFADAEKLALSLTREFPEYPFGWKVLGAVLGQRGRKSEAVDANQTSVALSPLDAECHSNLGAALQKLGRLEEAEASYKKALALKPDFAEAHNNLGSTLQELGRIDEGIERHSTALASQPDNASFLSNLSNAKAKAVPGWHIPMMNEHGRNEAYQKAMRSAIQGGDVVLDIGTGAGLLSMIAADCGAKEITTCEMSPTISKIAQQIIQTNGFEHKVKVINKNSKDLILGQDINKKADILVSEILSSELVGEGIQATILDAKERLVKKNGKMIPEGGSIMIALIENTGKLAKELFVDNALGFDISNFNSITTHKWAASLEDEPQFLSEPIEAFTFDFRNFEKIYRDAKTIKIEVKRAGVCAGVVQWLKVQLYDDIEYQNNPMEMYRLNSVSGWKTPIFKFHDPVNVTKGQLLSIQATLAEDYCWFDLGRL